MVRKKPDLQMVRKRPDLQIVRKKPDLPMLRKRPALQMVHKKPDLQMLRNRPDLQISKMAGVRCLVEISFKRVLEKGPHRSVKKVSTRRNKYLSMSSISGGRNSATRG